MQPLLIKAKVNEFQSWFRKYIGEGVPMMLEWDRTGAQTFDLIGGQRTQWTALAIYGRQGQFRVSAKQSRLPVNDAGLWYTVDGDDIKLELTCLVPGLARQLSPASDVVSAGAEPAVGFPAISTLMTVVSVLSFVWQVIHPRVTLTLPGTVGCQITLNGDVITIDLLKPLPSIEVTAVVTFKPQLARVIVSQSKIRCEFVGSTVREREFPIA